MNTRPLSVVNEQISFVMHRIINVVDNHNFFLYEDGSYYTYCVKSKDIIEHHFISFCWFYDEC